MTEPLKVYPKFKLVREGGRAFTGYLKLSPNATEIREDGRLFTGWQKFRPRSNCSKFRGSLSIG